MIKTKKIITFITIVLILCCNTSCNHLIKIALGLKKPIIESKISISKFAKKMNLDLNHVFLLEKDTVYDTFTKEHISPKLIDEVLIYNKDGFLLTKDTSKIKDFCAMPQVNIFSVINDTYKIDSNQNINLSIKQLININNLPIPDYTKYDYTLIYYWAKWYKGFSKKRFKEINKIVSTANDSLKIDVMYVNIDLLDDNYTGSFLSERYKICLKLALDKEKSCSDKCATKK